MAQCSLCEQNSADISKTLSVCLACIRQRPREALEIAARVHRECRAAFGLPIRPPDNPEGLSCNICVNRCRMAENEIGYCGLRRNNNGRLVGVSSTTGKLSWYHDPLPTNCVADWVCPAGTGAGYPKFANRCGAETGFKNLAVFFQGCSFNCLFCQNWHFRNETFASSFRMVEELVADADEQTSCICYFGGDPSPQMPFSLKASKQAREKATGRILRICWETNGCVNPDLLDQMLGIAKEFISHDYNVLTFDMRGHGESDGKHISAGLYERNDLTGAIDYIRQRGITSRIGVLGFSMGAGTSLMTTPECKEIDAVVSDSAYADIVSIIESEFANRSDLPKFFIPIVLFMTRNLYDVDFEAIKPVEAVKEITVPVFIIHGVKDAMVPVEHAYSLAEACQNPDSQ